jgi:hypothetical protein
MGEKKKGADNADDATPWAGYVSTKGCRLQQSHSFKEVIMHLNIVLIMTYPQQHP